MDPVQYWPQVFVPSSLEHAKSIILSADSTEESWKRETEETVTSMIEAFAAADRPIGPTSLLLDYGCGVGRLSRHLIERTGCTVLGTDIVPKMLEYSVAFVNSANFIVCPQRALPTLERQGLRVDGAFAVWVLQHCYDPRVELDFIARLLGDAGLLFVVNKTDRFVPVVPDSDWAKWHDDGVDVRSLARARFDEIRDCGSAGDNYCALLRKR